MLNSFTSTTPRTGVFIVVLLFNSVDKFYLGAQMKPIFPTESMTTFQKQGCAVRFNKEVQKNTNQFLKGTGWRRNSSWIFKAHENWYFTTHAWMELTFAGDSYDPIFECSEFGIKTLSVDNVNWKYQGLGENVSKPLSFRSNAAHKVPALIVSNIKRQISYLDPKECAKSLVDLILEQESQVKNMMPINSFSKMILSYTPEKKMSALYWSALISEGRGSEAMELIEKHYLSPLPEEPRRLERAQEIVNKYAAYVRNLD